MCTECYVNQARRKMDEALRKWLDRSRAANPKCGCDKRGDRWFFCSYHEGAVDAWEDAYNAGELANHEMSKK